MKRLLARIGITAFSALAVAFYLPEKAVVILLLLALAAAAVFIAVRRTRRTVFIPAMAATVALACAVNIAYTYVAVRPVQQTFAGEGRRIEATLCDEEYRAYSKYYYRLNAHDVDGKPASAKLLLKTSAPIDIRPFDEIAFTADISPTDNNYYLSKGYFVTVDTYSEAFEVTGAESRPLYYHAILLRQSLRSAVDEYLPAEEAALCKAIFVGDKYALNEDTKADFKYAGASYFIVVSGLHFSVICLLFFKLLKKLRVNRYVCIVLAVLLILVYMAVTGFQTSVVRSGVMMFVFIVSHLFRRINDPLTSLGIAGLLAPFVFSPYGPGDVGLILSFASTFSIIVWHGPIYNKLHIKNPDNLFKRLLNVVINILSASLAANILVFPISLLVFRAFSTVTLLSSLLLYFPIEIILVLTLLICVFFYLGPLRYVSLVLSWPLYALCKAVLWLIRAIASVPFSYIYIGDVYVYIWLGVTIVLGIVVIALRNGYKFLPAAALLSAIVLLTGMITTCVVKLNTLSLEIFDCGEGVTAGLDNQGTLYMLSFDAQSRQAYDLLRDLTRRYGGARLAVCSTSRDLRNYSRLSDKEFAISSCIVYDKNVGYSGSAELIDTDSNDSYILGDGVTLTLAQSGKKLMSYLNVRGTTVLLLPDKFPFKDIPGECRSADIIIMSTAAADYDKLSCSRLIVSNTQEKATEAYNIMKTRCDYYETTCSGSISIDMR